MHLGVAERLLQFVLDPVVILIVTKRLNARADHMVAYVNGGKHEACGFGCDFRNNAPSADEKTCLSGLADAVVVSTDAVAVNSSVIWIRFKYGTQRIVSRHALTIHGCGLYELVVDRPSIL